MRPPERIPVVLKHIKWKDFLMDMFKGQEIDFDIFVSDVINELPQLTQVWEENPDWRLTQLLVNTGMIPNIPGTWYYVEEVEYIIEKGWCKPEDILFWGTYGIDGKQPLKFILIRDMDSEHIQACLDNVKTISGVYKKVMKNVLMKRNRKKKLLKISDVCK